MKQADYYDAEYFDNAKSGKGYGAHGFVYDKNLAPWGRLANILCEYCQPVSVADYGCARGFLLAELLDCGVMVRGYDFSSYILASADCRVALFLKELNLAEPREYEPVDLAICTDILGHLDKDVLPDVIDRIQRATRQFMYCHIELAGEHDARCAEHEVLLDREDWITLLTANGTFVVDERMAQLRTLLRASRENPGVGWFWSERAILLKRKGAIDGSNYTLSIPTK